MMERPVPNFGHFELAEVGRPPELPTPATAAEDEDLRDFFLVAYGLSFPALEVPQAHGPGDVRPLRFVERLGARPDQDELYPH
jgi:hypothetical protein